MERLNKIKSFMSDRVIPHLKTFQASCSVFFMGRMKNIFLHLRSFWMPWLFFVLMFVVSIIPIPWKLCWLSLLTVFFVIALLWRPMNVIHGLIGTRGDIKLYFRMFIYINLFFSGIYYFGFFKHSGITYDINQPHIEFNLFEYCSEKGQPVLCNSGKETLPIVSRDSIHYYYKTTYPWVLQNTILTSLMQEPTDFYSVSSTFTGSIREKRYSNYWVAYIFNWFLIFHILISWILLGVFISLL